MKKIDDGPVEVEPAAPTFGERTRSFWMDGKKYDPAVADQMTSFPAVVSGIAMCFAAMIALGLLMG